MKFKAIRNGISAAEKKAFPFKQELSELKLIVFSDHHRGSRDGADDFLCCEETYTKALNYYFQNGYTLILLGDVDELWENEPNKVLNNYEEVLCLEQEFYTQNRLMRVWGNHDDLWQFPNKTKALLGNYFPNIQLYEAINLIVLENNEEIGKMLFLHGHQGTLMSAQLADFSKFFVRFFWRPFQRIFKVALSTPSKNKKLRSDTDKAMDLWANIRNRQLIACGHTHQYIFGSFAVDSTDDKPCYFNTGCCSYGNGNISGLEISNQKIRIVEWTPDDNEPYYVQKAPLKSIFERCESSQ